MLIEEIVHMTENKCVCEQFNNTCGEFFSNGINCDLLPVYPVI